MDGGRVLRALLASRLGYVRATEIAAMVGQWVAFVLGFLGLFGNPLLIFIAIFVYLAASSEAHLVATRAMSHGVPVTAAMMTQFATLTPDEHVDAAVQTLLRTSQGEFPVVDGRAAARRAQAQRPHPRAKERGPDARVADAMTVRAFRPSNKNRCLDEAFRLLQEKSVPAVGVVDVGTPGRTDHVRDHRRNADAASGAADRRALWAMGSVRPQRGLRRKPARRKFPPPRAD